ncbi:hypothetical protein [Caulobacter hibisci]|uniref:Uncharacterized protein n=1 Tax=Caulobacter hibisci TaxID=2035993 RepID=A0ABS0T559_9CAUL|nr:hypothetical protein [Caulobacter hibisci]MBI1686819.1 hypothetical protein [Caulobacter hibisci]
MPTFGFSAFLKMLSLSPRRQRTEMRNRLLPSDSAYDFHRAFRRFARRYLAGGEPIGSLLREASEITNPAEGRSAIAALEYLEDWRSDHPGRVSPIAARVYSDPEGRYKVRYEPDFGIDIDGVLVAVHIWNTKLPALEARMTYAALTLMAELYADEPGDVPDLAVLSVPGNRLYRLSDVPDQSVLAANVASGFSRLIEDVRRELWPPSQPGEDRPDRR